MPALTLSYEGITVRASLERAVDVQWLEEFLLPWFDRSDDAPDVEVLVSRDPAYYEELLACGPADSRVIAFTMDTRAVDFPAWNVPGQLALYDEKHRLFYLVTDSCITLVGSDPGNEVRMSLMRVLREFAMSAAQLRGGRFLHASAFVTNGLAALISGPREVGKTSLLSYVLSYSDARFMCNDRLLVGAHEPALRLRGMPTIVSIREGTLELLPGMRDSIERNRFITRSTMEEARQPDAPSCGPPKQGRYGLSPRQYCALLGCEPVQWARGAVLLLPRQTRRPGGLELKRLDSGEARERLAHCLFGHIGPDRLSEVFTLLPRSPGQSKPGSDDALCTMLASRLACYDCQLGTDTYRCDTAARQLQQLLLAAGPARPADAFGDMPGDWP